jgi:hypothetical protein
VDALATFHKANAQAIKLDPKKQAFLQRRNEALLKKFTKDELEDDLGK